MQEEQAFNAKCIDCGVEFFAKKKSSVRCPSCQKKREKELRKKSKAASRERKMIARTTKFIPKGDQDESLRCPYCGAYTDDGDYCDECIEQGFNELHKMFGSTNGWDKPPKTHQKVEIEPGWRGNKVIGGSATNERYTL